MKAEKLLISWALALLVSCAETDPESAFKRGNYAAAAVIWEARAKQDDADAQNHLGTHYLLGMGVERDYSAAKYWYEKAAKQGHPDAQRNLGSMYEAGHGSYAPDIEQAFIWYYAAHRQGHSLAGPSLEAIAGMTKLTPNNQIVLKKKAREYIVNEVLGPQDNDY